MDLREDTALDRTKWNKRIHVADPMQLRFENKALLGWVEYIYIHAHKCIKDIEEPDLFRGVIFVKS